MSAMILSLREKETFWRSSRNGNAVWPRKVCLTSPAKSPSRPTPDEWRWSRHRQARPSGISCVYSGAVMRGSASRCCRRLFRERMHPPRSFPGSARPTDGNWGISSSWPGAAGVWRTFSPSPMNPWSGPWRIAPAAAEGVAARRSAAERAAAPAEDVKSRIAAFRDVMGRELRGRLENLGWRLAPYRGAGPARDILPRLENVAQRLDDLASVLAQGLKNRLDREGHRIALARRTLEEAGPPAVLARGYARVTRDGRNITDAGDLEPGDDIDIRFRTGGARAEVKEVNGT